MAAGRSDRDVLLRLKGASGNADTPRVWKGERHFVACGRVSVSPKDSGDPAFCCERKVSHPMNDTSDIQSQIQAHLDAKEQLTCEAAHLIAYELGTDPLSVGDQATANGVRITRCQLGFFGYAAQKGMPGYKIVRKLNHVPQAVTAAVREVAKNGQVSCAELWQIGQALGISKADMGNMAETLGVKVRPCQLGCF